MLEISKDNYKKTFLVTLFGIAFGYLEASVVVYLRQLFYPSGFSIPLKLSFPYIIFAKTPFLNPIPLDILLTEIFREVSTMVILFTVAFISGNTWKEKLAFFLLPFGVWDIFYYIFLKLLIGWPPFLFTLDVLFLIPVPWIAPVWMPVLASVLFILTALVLLKGTKQAV
ncbi:MAG: hypothetical protein LHV68_10000 [Elusimicrobia bacterium]|nr:hypothetical protein [Candidatus Liberimonas magnetica]